MIYMNVFIKREYDYAIRMCAYLAGRDSNQPISLGHVSQKLAISRPFAAKIIFKLRQKNIIGTVQGKHGGVFLKADPHKLSLLDVLKAMDFDSTLNECLRNPQICPLISICKIHVFFLQQETQLLNTLKEKKIIEFVFSDADLDTKLSYAENRKTG